MIKLTLEHLKEMKPGTMFAGGFFSFCEVPLKVKWVAVRGGIHDWTIYAGPITWDNGIVASRGDKVYSKDRVRRLVWCTDEAYEMYRY